jgi:hypothetical protein
MREPIYWGVCPDCQQQGIETIYKDGELVLQEHANQAGKHCVGSYGFPQATYEKKEKVNG